MHWNAHTHGDILVQTTHRMTPWRNDRFPANQHLALLQPTKSFRLLMNLELVRTLAPPLSRTPLSPQQLSRCLCWSTRSPSYPWGSSRTVSPSPHYTYWWLSHQKRRYLHSPTLWRTQSLLLPLLPLSPDPLLAGGIHWQLFLFRRGTLKTSSSPSTLLSVDVIPSTYVFRLLPAWPLSPPWPTCWTPPVSSSTPSQPQPTLLNSKWLLFQPVTRLLKSPTLQHLKYQVI